nr:hypothetical protein [Acidithiobacillus sulfuriphilus]
MTSCPARERVLSEDANAVGPSAHQHNQGNGRQHPTPFIQEIFQKQFTGNLCSIAVQRSQIF